MNLHRILLCCAALAGIASPRPATAQGQPTSTQLAQTVRLNDGSIYQGDLVELVPNDHLTLRLATGEIKRFAWTEIQFSSTSGGAPAPVIGATLPFLIPSLAAPPPPSPGDMVQLHFQADDPQAVLFSTRTMGGIHFNNPGQVFDGAFSDSTMVCPRAPCDITADRRLIYGVQGPGIIRSLPFTLPQGNSVTADARVAHQSTRSLFTLMTVLGGAGVLSGMILLTFGGVQDTNPDAFYGPMAMQMLQDTINKQHTYFVAGGALMGSGAALIITGIIASVYSRTSLSFQSDGRLALQLPGKMELDPAAMQVRF